MPPMAGPPTILRVKRKLGDVLEENLLVEGLLPRKRAALSDGIVGLDLNNNGEAPLQQPFRHLTTITADSSAWDSPSWLAALLQGSPPTPALGKEDATDGPEHQDARPEEPDTQGHAVRVFDVVRPRAVSSAKMLERWQDPWLAMLALAPGANGQEETQNAAAGAAAGSSGNVSVYDIYSLSTEAGEAGGESLAALGAPLVQVVDDYDLFLEDQEDSAADSEDSNAEDHFTHDYPDEEDCDEDKTSSSHSDEQSDGDYSD